LVKLSERLIRFALKLGLPIEFLIKKTVYRQFVGGKDLKDCQPLVEDLRRYGVMAVLDYAAEGCDQEMDFDSSCDEILKSIEFPSNEEGIKFAVFKLTAMARFSLLEKIQKGFEITPSEQDEWSRVATRVERLCQMAAEREIMLMIDAEESWIQDPIDDLALKMMRRFNGNRPVVFNTLQMYRKDRLVYLKSLAQLAKGESFFLGIKFVRGAYLEKERNRALELGYDSPIHETKEHTDRDFDLALDFCLSQADRITVFAGTHNEASTVRLTELMAKYGLPVDDPRVHFSQLFGMSDHISFNLAAKGFNVTKYVPYGPVEKVMPYLFRRAEENTSIKGQMSRELSLIAKERTRRKNKGNYEV
jgi:proline dehydrogenase